jgi:hypothetical protein
MTQKGLRKHVGNPDEPDLKELNKKACLYAELPKRSLVMHQMECWEATAWDVKRHVSQHNSGGSTPR